MACSPPCFWADHGAFTDQQTAQRGSLAVVGGHVRHRYVVWCPAKQLRSCASHFSSSASDHVPLVLQLGGCNCGFPRALSTVCRWKVPWILPRHSCTKWATALGDSALPRVTALLKMSPARKAGRSYRMAWRMEQFVTMIYTCETFKCDP